MWNKANDRHRVFRLSTPRKENSTVKDDVVVLRPLRMPRDSAIRLQRKINAVHLSYGPLHDLYHRLKQQAPSEEPTRH